MAEWFMDGMLKRLLDHHDPVSRKLLQQAVFYVVRPCLTLLCVIAYSCACCNTHAQATPCVVTEQSGFSQQIICRAALCRTCCNLVRQPGAP